MFMPRGVWMVRMHPAWACQQGAWGCTFWALQYVHVNNSFHDLFVALSCVVSYGGLCFVAFCCLWGCRVACFLSRAPVPGHTRSLLITHLWSLMCGWQVMMNCWTLLVTD